MRIPSASNIQSPVQIALSGYYGCGNTGDEAVLAGIHQSIVRRAGTQARLVVLSQSPARTTQLHGLEAVDRMRMTQVRALLKESDLLVSGGGSLLQDTTSLRSLLYYLWIAQIALACDTPVMFYAQGMGPLRRSISRLLVRAVANRASAITVRDQGSADLLSEIGVDLNKVVVTADPAFALAPASDAEVEMAWRAEGLPNGQPVIGVALRPWGGSGESPVANYALLLTELGRQTECRIVLIPMHAGEDVTFARQVASETGNADAFPIVLGSYSPGVILGIIARTSAVVALRLHALIFAIRSGVPPFALSYDPKVDSLMKTVDMADCLASWRDFNAHDVAARVASLVTAREFLRSEMLPRAALLEELALRNTDYALAIARRTRQTRARS